MIPSAGGFGGESVASLRPPKEKASELLCFAAERSLHTLLSVSACDLPTSQNAAQTHLLFKSSFLHQPSFCPPLESATKPFLEATAGFHDLIFKPAP